MNIYLVKRNMCTFDPGNSMILVRNDERYWDSCNRRKV